MADHHSTKAQVAPGIWDVARPLRGSWWIQWQAERACRKAYGHCWHPEGLTDWWCCMCSADTEGAPPQRCKICTAKPTGPAEQPEPARPEAICHRCGGPNIAWSAPSPLWNSVMRGGSINGEEEFDGIVCPPCFARLAEERGIAELWRFSAGRVHVELETVTPSGRTWDDATWLWREPISAEEPEPHSALNDRGHLRGCDCEECDPAAPRWRRDDTCGREHTYRDGCVYAEQPEGSA
ncbi:hypothetical protein Drose_04375 [Dactylosporangium roseum]|uniref:Uncharacterized protein n=1 Tax=Dactylosporangium roseum TaxID=47989 RepID=A0ABY5Z678_9ACTN|nr:hypothetical protein [Dactylosporangium roseum]UWZ37526.1 hypothetical protein Drose_04375 [Dactylosporangium roseum]